MKDVNKIEKGREYIIIIDRWGRYLRTWKKRLKLGGIVKNI